MGGIARTVGKSRSTLYLYYKDKDAIFGAVVGREIKAYLAEQTGGLTLHPSAVERLRAYFRIKFAKATEYLIMNREMVQQPEMVNRMRICTVPLLSPRVETARFSSVQLLLQLLFVDGIVSR